MVKNYIYIYNSFLYQTRYGEEGKCHVILSINNIFDTNIVSNSKIIFDIDVIHIINIENIIKIKNDVQKENIIELYGNTHINI